MAVLTDQELQSTLRVSRQTLWRLRKRSALPYFKVGGQYRYRSEDIDRWLAESRYRDLQLPLILPAGEKPGQRRKRGGRNGRSRS